MSRFKVSVQEIYARGNKRSKINPKCYRFRCCRQGMWEQIALRAAGPKVLDQSELFFQEQTLVDCNRHTDTDRQGLGERGAADECHDSLLTSSRRLPSPLTLALSHGDCEYCTSTSTQ